MASERAKQLAAEQKAQLKAEKQRKKSSNDPKDWGRGRQFLEAFKVTYQYDHAVVWLMIGAFVAVTVIFLLVGLLWLSPWWMWLIMGILFGLLAAMYILSWRAKGAMFKRYAGQPGSAEVAMNLLGKKWVKYPVIAVNRYQDIVHRVLGPAGIVLIGEGAPGRVREMLNTEQKTHESIKYAVPVTTVVMGDAANQVPLSKLDKYIKNLEKPLKKAHKTIEPAQVTEVQARLKALDERRNRLPIPKGPMPSTRGARAALRGR